MPTFLFTWLAPLGWASASTYPAAAKAAGSDDREEPNGRATGPLGSGVAVAKV